MNNKKVIYGLVVSALIVMALAFTANQQAVETVHGAAILSVARPASNTVDTIFTENTLPAGGFFTVRYDNITKNTTNRTIVFVTLPGKYAFVVYNSIVGNTIYVPTPSRGNLTTGSTILIRFSG